MNNQQSPDTSPILPNDVTSATPLSPLDLNGYKLDIKHTILTPEYIENLEKNKVSK